MPTALPPIRTSLLVSLTLAALAPLADAHEGDPKALDRRPRIEVRRSGSGSQALSSDTFSFPASGVNLMSWLPLPEFGDYCDSGNSCFGYVSPSGREYALIGLSLGTGFVEVTDPGAPVLVGVIAGPQSLWRDVRVHQNHAYMASEGGGGIQIVDMSQIDSGVVTLVGAVNNGTDTGTHTLALDTASGFLYRAGGSQGGLRAYSLANPALPVLAGSWLDRYVHEAQVVTYTSGPYAGRQIAFCCGGFNGGFSQTGLDILDVTNKQNITLIKRWSYPNAGYSHQGWLSPDRKYFYLNDEKDEQNGTAPPSTTRVINVENLSSPFLAATFSSGAGSIDHNLYTKGNLIFEANYTSGLRVFSTSNPGTPTAPVEIAWFDTWPQDDLTKFHSLWNNYPYLPSGTVFGSDIEQGLFVWTIGAPKVDFSFASGAPETFDPEAGVITVEIAEASPGAMLPGSATFSYDVGAGWNTLPLAAQGGGTFSADLPPIPCGTDVAWYVSARSAGAGATGPATWRWPEGAPTIVAHSTAALTQSVVLAQDFASSGGWTSGVPSDTATNGLWELADPQGTYAQADDDHTPGDNKLCWVTGREGEPWQMGFDDVDGGETTLVTADYDLSALATPALRYWRWYSNHLGQNPNTDVFVVDVSNDGGQSWTRVETLGPGGPETVGGWILHQFRVADFVAPTSTVRLRFVAADTGPVSNVEAAIDDFAILDLGCPAEGPTVYCTAKTNSQGCTPAIGSSGSPSASSSSPFLVTASHVINQKSGFLLYAFGAASTPFQGGTLCLAPPLTRTTPQNSGGSTGAPDCSGTYAYDFNARIQSGIDPLLVVGATVDAQWWSRDPLDPTGFGTGLTDAIEFTIAP